MSRLLPWLEHAMDGDLSSFPGLDALYPELDAFYVDLHASPELSGHEVKTAAKLAARLRKLGFEVTTGVGGTGVVGVLRNGAGPTVMLRTELDALPVEEKTGLAFASQSTVTNGVGKRVPVMHACGHDIHMTGWIGAATLLSRSKDRWRGTLLLIGQPAEELGSGAAAMLADGLYTRFPKPDFAVAVHDTPLLPSGKVAITPGFALANADTVEVTIHGRGGHGAYPHEAIDPVVIAARSVLALQTIVAREVNPIDPAVVTVGSIHGGTKAAIIPDDVTLQITVRSYKAEVQKHLLSSIERISRSEAAAAGASQPPTIVVDPHGTRATFNDPKLIRRLAAVLSSSLRDGVVELPPVMGAEDFSEFGRAGVPLAYFFVGAIEPEKFHHAKASGAPLPSLHSSSFAPDRERTIRAATTVLTSSALELMTHP